MKMLVRREYHPPNVLAVDVEGNAVLGHTGYMTLRQVYELNSGKGQRASKPPATEAERERLRKAEAKRARKGRARAVPLDFHPIRAHNGSVLVDIWGREL